MPTHTRVNAWKNGGTFNDPNLLWYAKGVQAMKARPLDDPSSWWFFAAMHGHNLDAGTPLYWGSLGLPPNAIAPVPANSVADRFWDQCQHKTWFFLPWHRGYLLALEAHLRAAIAPLKGDDQWALPYWNYFGPPVEHKIPPAFTQACLPDGTPNPLLVPARFGPDYDGNVYVQTSQQFSWVRSHPTA